MVPPIRDLCHLRGRRVFASRGTAAVEGRATFASRAAVEGRATFASRAANGRESAANRASATIDAAVEPDETTFRF